MRKTWIITQFKPTVIYELWVGSWPDSKLQGKT